MSISISKAQEEALNELGGFAEDKDGPVTLSITAKVLAQYGGEFKLQMAKLANQRQVVGSGKLIDSVTPEIAELPGITILQIRVLDYFDFPNEGVKGVRNNKNAPNSPYKFKNYGVGPNMAASLRAYILSGKAKVRVKDKATVGLEAKNKRIATVGKRPLIDQQVFTLGYLIKRFGIKATHYFTDAFKETFKDFEITMSEAVGRDIVFTLEKLNRKK